MKIQDNESKADEILRNARLDAKQALEDAESQAAKMVEEEKSKGKEQYDACLQDGQAEADRQYERFLEKTREDCGVMMDAASKKQDKAVAFIAEGIVGASVNH